MTRHAIGASWALASISTLIMSATSFAQSVPVRTLAKATQTYAEPFSRVADVREQSDGRVVVLDRKDIRIVRIDMAKGTATPLGRSGQGPGEYTLPIHLVALPGDTTVAPDMTGGGLALVITRDAVAGTPLRAKGFENNIPLFKHAEIQSDSRGRLYEAVERYVVQDGKRMQRDSGGIRRLDRKTGAQDTIGMVHRMTKSALIELPKSPVTFAPSPTGARAGGPPPPYASVDQWTVAPDGRVAVVSVFPYRVTFYGENGQATVGPPIGYTPVKVTAVHKTRWRELKTQPVPVLRYVGNTISAGASVPKYQEPDSWPDVLPPFVHDAVRFAPDGNLWVERADTNVPTFDIIDRTGRVISRVALPAKSRLVGLGNRSVYLVRIDNDDLETLERHVLPQ